MFMARAPNVGTQLICASVFAWLAVQTAVNVRSYRFGYLPLKGITLRRLLAMVVPVWVFVMAALGLVFQISMYTSMRKSLGRSAGAGTYRRYS